MRLVWIPMVALVVLLAGCTSAPATTRHTDAAPGGIIPAVPHPSPNSTAPTLEPAALGSIPAIELLARLAIRPALPINGYVRTADFGEAWIDVDHNGCDTRDDILSRDLTDTTKSGQCKVETGLLTSPYTGGVIHFVRGENTSADVQIDHVVALGDAWQTGAQDLTEDERITLANDPLELLAVDAASNDEKSDKDAAEWLPPNVAFDCTYVARQISVKLTYSLWVTRAEHNTMAHVLAGCPTIDGTASEFAMPAPASTPSAIATPTPANSKTSPGSPSPGSQVVHAGAYCTERGAHGETANGAAMVCDTTATDTRLRWRSAG